MTYVSSTDVPVCIAAKVAAESHRRGCGTFDGGRIVGAPAFDGGHRAHDTAIAAARVADVCNALGVDLGQLWRISSVAAGDSPRN